MPSDTFIVQVTIDVSGQTDPEAVSDQVFKALEALPAGSRCTAMSAWRIFDHEPKTHAPYPELEKCSECQQFLDKWGNCLNVACPEH